MTWQTGIFDKWMVDHAATRSTLLFQKLFDERINCTLTHGINHTKCKEEMLQFESFVQHDINLIPYVKWFEIEQYYDHIKYGATIIFELHYDEVAEQRGECAKESCLHVKIFLNDKHLFNEFSFCDYKTGKCPYDKFKRDMQNKMLVDIDPDQQCNVPFDPITLSRHRVYLS